MDSRGRRVAVFSLGGTIAMAPQPEGGVAPALSANELLAAVPGLADLNVTTEVYDFRRLPGASLGFADLFALAGEIATVARSGIDGVVVTQGTDTIEETAYFLDLLHPADTPLIVTGAMRSATAAGADGPANLLSALRVAASTEARGLGALVVFADEIHAARFVRKAHATRVTAFASEPGPLGAVVEDTVDIRLRLRRGLVIEADPSRSIRTALQMVSMGDDGSFLEAISGRADGVVVSAFGAGHVPAGWVPILTDMVARIPVVLTTRTGAGSVLSHTYGFAGSESDLLKRGLISAGFLDPLKARILLQLLLMAGASRAAIDEAFSNAGGRPGHTSK